MQTTSKNCSSKTIFYSIAQNFLRSLPYDCITDYAPDRRGCIDFFCFEMFSHSHQPEETPAGLYQFQHSVNRTFLGIWHNTFPLMMIWLLIRIVRPKMEMFKTYSTYPQNPFNLTLAKMHCKALWIRRNRL